jgi:hypothetical protein
MIQNCIDGLLLYRWCALCDKYHPYIDVSLLKNDGDLIVLKFLSLKYKIKGKIEDGFDSNMKSGNRHEIETIMQESSLESFSFSNIHNHTS